MKVNKTAGKLVIKMSILPFLMANSKMMARRLEFDYVKQMLTITRGKARRRKTTIPFSSIRKIYHRIYGQEDNFIIENQGNNNAGQSSLSIVFLDIINMPNETIYMESYERGGKASIEARQIILKIQNVVDEIAHFIWKPVVIECKEIGFFVDMEKRQMSLQGLTIPLSKVWLVQTVETDRGFYAVEVYTSSGEVYVTAEGRDRTIHIFETVRMVADRAGLSSHRVRNRDNDYPFRGIPYQEIRVAPGRKDKARKMFRRVFTDKAGDDDGEALEEKRN